jgi:peroxiredoxin
MLKPGDAAPDFAIGETTLFNILKQRKAVVFFFPKAFTPG